MHKPLTIATHEIIHEKVLVFPYLVTPTHRFSSMLLQAWIYWSRIKMSLFATLENDAFFVTSKEWAYYFNCAYDSLVASHQLKPEATFQQLTAPTQSLNSSLVVFAYIMDPQNPKPSSTHKLMTNYTLKHTLQNGSRSII